MTENSHLGFFPMDYSEIRYFLARKKTPNFSLDFHHNRGFDDDEQLKFKISEN